MKIVIPAERPRAEMTLEDGTVLTLSPVLKTDREFFEKGLEELSEESRFSRFGQGVSSLTQHELEYLTDVDQRHHVAWGAAIDDEAAGVGRYIADGAGGAEVAITVLDSMQRRGVGRALFRALVAVARSDGLHEVYFEARADNQAVMGLVSGIEVTPFVRDGVIERRIRLAELPTSRYDEALVSVIREVRGAEDDFSAAD